MKICNKVACAFMISGLAATAHAQVSVVSDLLATATPVLGMVVPQLTAPLAGNDAVQQGSAQLLGTLNPLINSFLVQGGDVGLQLLGAATALDTIALPGLESLGAPLFDVGPLLANVPLIR